MITTLLLAAVALAAPHDGDAVDALERALASVSRTSIRSDLEFLAADVMAGRDTPSAELEIAAQYLLNRVQRIGSLQAGADGAWFQSYDLERDALSAESRLFLTASGLTLELRPLEGYLWVSCEQATSTIEGTAICIGDGRKATLDQIGSDALQGRWAVTTELPRMLQTTRRRLSSAGAVGLLVISAASPDELADDKPSRAVLRTTSLLKGGGYGLALDRADDRLKRPDFPILQLQPATTAQWLATAPETKFEAGVVLDLAVREARVAVDLVPVRNLCALLPGTDPERADEVIVCSAHYDHVGVREGVTYPGADDNASGTSGLLALAEALVRRGPLERSVLFVWLSGEEQGLWGSQAFCADLPLAPDMRVVMNLNIDMIGRTSPGELYITPSREHESFGPLSELAYAHGAAEGFAELVSQDEFYRASDHYNFARMLEVPVVFLSTGDHPDYHEPGDTPDKIDVEKLSRVVRLTLRMLEGMSALELAPAVER